MSNAEGVRRISSVSSPLVSVIIPAHNAAQTLDETLRSVRSQTYRNLEVVVVDDGSIDDTAAVADRHARLDSRVRVIRQANAGVASARNTGIAATSGEYIAPIDADDLWAPDKIEQQVRTFLSGKPTLGLVYSWFCVIDIKDRILWHEDRCIAQGSVLPDMLARNLVGNGSCPLMLRSAVEWARGYDSNLRGRGSEGAEDFMLYLQIAQKYDFACVPQFLVGYRDSPGNMSNNVHRMIRSRDLCVAEFARNYPHCRDAIEIGRMRFLRFMAGRCAREGRAFSAMQLVNTMFKLSPRGAAASFIELVAERLVRCKKTLRGEYGTNDTFEIGQPREDGSTVVGVNIGLPLSY